MACFAYLQEHEAGTTAKLQLSTTWQRDYQVSLALPSSLAYDQARYVVKRVLTRR